MVLRAKPAIVLPEFLAFFMQSNLFMERAVEISVGSLSPTINWKTLAQQEFELPPQAEQRRIGLLLQAANETINAIRESTFAGRKVLDATLIDLIERRGELWQVTPLENAVSRFIDYRGRTPQKSELGVPLVTAKTVRDGYLDFSEPEWIAAGDYSSWMTRGIPNEGDVLFTTEAPLGLVAKAPQGKFALAQRIICLQPAEGIDPSFLFWTVKSFGFQREIRKRSTGTTVSGVKQSVLRQIPIRVPSVDIQLSIARALDALAQAVELVQERHSHQARLSAQLLSHVCS